MIWLHSDKLNTAEVVQLRFITIGYVSTTAQQQSNNDKSANALAG